MNKFIPALLSVILLAFSFAPSPASAQSKPAPVPLDQWERQPILAVPPVHGTAPKIDGHVDFKEWYYAACVSAFYDPEIGGLTQYPVRMYLCYDDQALYVALTITRPPMNPTPKATFAAGPHPSIWWKDDNFELVVTPGIPGKTTQYGYAFAGNSIGGYSDLRYHTTASGSDAAWNGKWEYKATRGRDTWSAELKIPYSQFEGVTAPKPGDQWLFDTAIQSVTPHKQMFDWSHMWSFGQSSYRSTTKGRLIFVDKNGPIFRLSQVGAMSPTGKLKEKGITPIGMRAVLYNQGDKPYTLDCLAELYRSDRRAEGMLNFMDLWDRLLTARRTGQPVTDPNETTQSFRNEASFLKELNERYHPVQTVSHKITVPAGKAAYFPLDVAKKTGEYVVAYRFKDAATGQLLASQAVPFEIRPKFDVALTPYFLEHQKLRVDIHTQDIKSAAPQVRVQLKVDGKTLASEQRPLEKNLSGEMHLYLSTADWPQKTKGQIVAELVDAEGKILESQTRTLERPADPAWWNQHLGLSQVVPAPFEPVKADGKNTVQVWNRAYRLGDNGLPASITSRGAELLSRPVSLKLDRPLKSQLHQLSATPRDAIFESVGQDDQLKLTTRTTVHYDGTLRFDIDLTPTGGQAQVKRLTLDIPLQKQWARLFTYNSTSTNFSRNEKDGLAGAIDRWFKEHPKGSMPFTFAFFLGYYDRGIQWFCPSDRGWSNADENQKIALVREGDSVILRISIVDKPLTLDKPLKLNFGLTVTPTKSNPPRGLDWAEAPYGKPSALRETGLEKLEKQMPIHRECGIRIVSSYLSDGTTIFGQPWCYDQGDRKFLKAFADLAHKYGLLYRPYSGWGINTNIPEFNTFGKEMLKEPRRNAGWGSYWHNPRSKAWADWWLGGARDCAQNLDFDGMYLDGTVMPELTANELDDMGWRDEQGNLHGTYPVWACREFLERLYILLHNEMGDKTRGFVDVHDGREPLYFVNVFADTTTSGEYHLKRGKTVLEVFSPAEYAAYYATYLQGNSRRFIWWNWMKLPITENEMRGMDLLHDQLTVTNASMYQRSEVGYDRDTNPWVRLRMLRAHYAQGEFVPYWDDRNPAVIDAQPTGLLASAWVNRKDKRALVAVVNLADKPWKGEVRLNLKRLGVDADAALADGMFDLPLNRSASAPLPLSIEPQRYRLILVNDRLPLLTPPKRDGTQKTLPIQP